MLLEPRDFFLHGKKVGTIYGDAYITERSAKRHYMRIFRGYPFSTYILMLLKTNGVKIIRVKETDRDDGKEFIYETFLSNFDSLELFQMPNQDAQKCLPILLWKKKELS